jgi:hypothetical protein
MAEKVKWGEKTDFPRRIPASATIPSYNCDRETGSKPVADKRANDGDIGWESRRYYRHEKRSDRVRLGASNGRQ